MRICLLGGAGYVGTELAVHLADKGHDVTVLDLFWFGDNLPRNKKIRKMHGDIRSETDLSRAMYNQEAVVHLACVSNDPSFDMSPKLGREINYDCFALCLRALKEHRVPKFIYASSSSVYGISDLKEVREDSPKDPLTDYSKFKLQCEMQLKAFGTGGVWTILRPATVCGYSRRLRLDLVVNILAMQAIEKRLITIFGRDQKRPNINIKDMVLAYDYILSAPDKSIDKQTFNVGFENLSLYQIANLVRNTFNKDVDIEEQTMMDPRSYHINSDKLLNLGFEPKYSIEEAVESLKEAFKCKLIKDPINNNYYYNFRRMKEIGLESPI